MVARIAPRASAKATSTARHCGLPRKHDAAHTAQHTRIHNKKGQRNLSAPSSTLRSHVQTYLSPLVGHPRQLAVAKNAAELPRRRVLLHPAATAAAAASTAASVSVPAIAARH